jgi:cytochrome P450
MITHPEPSWHGADPDEADFRATIHERYRHLRSEAPVSLTPRGAWRLTRHADCIKLLKHTKVGVRTTEGKLPQADETKMPRLFMLEQDPPDHGRLRKVVARYFTPRAMEKLHHRVQEITKDLLDNIGSGEFDLMKALALPLPTAVICEMMGVPPEDQVTFTEWTDDLTYFLMGTAATEEQQRRAGVAIGRMMEYITARIEERRDSDGEDLISVMLKAEGDERLSHMELLWQCVGLILAGFETTTGLIGNGVRQLLLHPEELARLRQDPSLIDTAVEECLRFDPPILATARYLHEEAEFGGYRIPVNARVTAILAAANRDQDEFEDPDRFDIGRTPNKHLGFGGGPHICLGAYLARLEAREAIGSLVKRFPNLRLVSDEQKWTGSLFRILAELPVTS